jgi:hypothetical protein
MACVAAALGRVDVLVAVLVAAARTAFVIGVPFAAFAAFAVLAVVDAVPASFAAVLLAVLAAPPATGDAFAVGSGCPMGVSYRMLAMKRPNMAPRPPPMTPAMTVLPTQDSIDAWICVYQLLSVLEYSKRRLRV